MPYGKKPKPIVQRLLPFAVLGLFIAVFIAWVIFNWSALTCLEPPGDHPPTCTPLADTAAISSFFTEWGENILKILPFSLIGFVLIMLIFHDHK